MFSIWLKFTRRRAPAKFINNYYGFTLIELMVVVGIIGILVSLTSSQYKKYSNKARQSEAKTGLAAIYSLEKSFYSEYGAYIPAFDAIGYAPEGSRRYYVQNICFGAAWASTVTGYVGGASTTTYSAQNSPFSLTFVYNGNTGFYETCAAYGPDPQAFNAYTQGNLGTPYDDIWTMTNLKILSNTAVGL